MTVHLYLLAVDGINIPAAYGTALLLMIMILAFNLSAPAGSSSDIGRCNELMTPTPAFVTAIITTSTRPRAL